MKAILLLLALAAPAFGRVGETAEQIGERLGAPTLNTEKLDLPPGTEIYDYHRNGFLIHVYFANGKSEREVYIKEDEGYISDKEALALRDAYGKRWQPSSESTVFGKKSWMTEDRKIFVDYTWSPKPHYVDFMTKEFRAGLAKAWRDAKKEKLKGF